MALALACAVLPDIDALGLWLGAAPRFENRINGAWVSARISPA
jgi:hypothetical protein